MPALRSKQGSTQAARVAMTAALIVGGCAPQYVPATTMSGDAIVATLSGNTMVSDMVIVPGVPVSAHLRKDGSVVGANLRQGQGDQAGVWKVSSTGYFCVKWPNWVEYQCGYVRDYHNGEYYWRGNTFTVLRGNPKAF
jgi:hypothetical protein